MMIFVWCIIIGFYYYTISASPIHAANEIEYLAYLHYNEGVQFSTQGNMQAAIDAYEKALGLKGDIGQAAGNLGWIYLGLKNSEKARYYFTLSRDISQKQKDLKTLSIAITNLGYITLLEATTGADGTTENVAVDPSRLKNVAIPLLQEAHEIDKTNIEALFNLANAYRILREFKQAMPLYEKVLNLKPDHSRSLMNIAFIHVASGQMLSAIPYLRQAAQCATTLRDRIDTLDNMGLALREAGLTKEALDAHWEASRLETTERVRSLVYVVLVKRMICDWQEFSSTHIALANRICATTTKTDSEPCNGIIPYDVLLFPYPAIENPLLAARSVAIRFAQPAHARTQQPLTPRRTLRVGYISYDMRRHPMGYLMEGIYRYHNRSNVKSYIFSTYPANTNDEQQEILRQTVDHFIDIDPRMSYENVANLIHSHQIDILVDLMGHTTFSVFQYVVMFPTRTYINYLGYPGTSGLSEPGSFIIVDSTVAPVENMMAEFTERPIVLPGTYQANFYQLGQNICPFALGLFYFQNCKRKNNRLGGDVSRIRFANFNKIDKFEPHSFQAWMNILHRIPNSDLILLKPSKASQDVEHNIHQIAAYHGVTPSRIVFVPKRDKREHLNRLYQVDIFLDNFYYGAHTTAVDILWAGVPIITLRGSNFPSRVGMSLLRALKMEHLLVANSVKEYENMAVAMATRSYLRWAISRKLTSQLRYQPLFRYEYVTANIETAYKTTQEIPDRPPSPRSILAVLSSNLPKPSIWTPIRDALSKNLSSIEISNVILRVQATLPHVDSYDSGILTIVFGDLQDDSHYVARGILTVIKHSTPSSDSVSLLLSMCRHLEPSLIGALELLLESNQALEWILNVSIKLRLVSLQRALSAKSFEIRRHKIELGALLDAMRQNTQAQDQVQQYLIEYSQIFHGEFDQYWLVENRSVLRLGAQLSALKQSSYALSIFKAAVRIQNAVHYKPHRFNTSTSKMRRVVFYCDEYGQTWWPKWGPKSPENKGAGGSEEAVIFLARELVKRDFQVEIYTDPPETDIGYDEFGVLWLPLSAYDTKNQPWAFISWRYHISAFLGTGSHVNIVWLHDLLLDTLNKEFEIMIQQRLVHQIIVGSHFHASLFGKQLTDHMTVLRLGIQEDYFIDGVNDRYTCIYASAPNRGLQELLEIWPSIHARVPQARLRIYYGFSEAFVKWGKGHFNNFDAWLTFMKNRIESLSDLNVEYIGMVPHHDLSVAYSQSGFVVYPTSFSETACISLMKAMAMGAIPITSRFINSSVPDLTAGWDMGPSVVETEPPMNNNPTLLQRYADSVVSAMTHEHYTTEIESHRARMKAWARKSLTWKSTASEFDAILNEISTNNYL